ncbi:MAG TPA: hypothetical protein VFP93_04615 [Gammaproteobacteria bacterium]|nr:hypothetical protein [Gammaproteobacteria bacterium]
MSSLQDPFILLCERYLLSKEQSERILLYVVTMIEDLNKKTALEGAEKNLLVQDCIHDFMQKIERALELNEAEMADLKGSGLQPQVIAQKRDQNIHAILDTFIPTQNKKTHAP